MVMHKTLNAILEYGKFRRVIYSGIRCLKHGMFHFFLNFFGNCTLFGV